MAGLFGVLRASAEAMDVIRRALDVSQNNVNNASTPGYVRQSLSLEALPFQPQAGLSGGVRAGTVQSSRAEYSEAAVRQRQQDSGCASQNARQSAAVEPAFDVSGESGIPGAINAIFQSLSALSANTDDAAAKASFLGQADTMARTFAAAATTLDKAAAQAESEIDGVAGTINELASRVRDYNSQVRRCVSATQDAGADAAVHSALEELAGLADITVLTQEDGSFTVLLGGQTPLVAGDEVYEVTVESSAGGIVLRDASGRDAAAHVTGGRLGALVGFRSATLPGWLGELNGLAAVLGTRINDVAGTAVFSWNAQNPAASLTAGRTVNLSSLDPEVLAAAAQSDPQTFTARYAAIATDVGRMAKRSREDAGTAEQLLNQARQMRADLCGVSLDEEAAYLLEWERSYQAAASLVKIVDEMTQQTLAMIR